MGIRRFVSLMILSFLIILLGITLHQIPSVSASHGNQKIAESECRPGDLEKCFKLPKPESPKIKNQNSYGDLAWQTFIALNWPANEGKADSSHVIGESPNSPRVWESYKLPVDVFKSSKEQESFNKGEIAPSFLITGDVLPESTSEYRVKDRNYKNIIEQAFSSFPVIDQDNRYIVYGTRINQIEVNQIVEEQWNNKQCITENLFLKPGAMEIKTAWKILALRKSENRAFISIKKDEEDQLFYTISRSFSIPKNYVINDDGSSPQSEHLRYDVKLGLVGFHIFYKLEHGPRIKDSEWMMATFEHKQITPIKDDLKGKNYVLYDQNCENKCKKNCEDKKKCKDKCEDKCTNTKLPIHMPKYRVNTSLEAMVRNGEEVKILDPIQVIRSDSSMPNKKIKKLNRKWSMALEKTRVWQNYRLIGVQWTNGLSGSPLSNPAIETYVDVAPIYNGKENCIKCHQAARIYKDKNRKISVDTDYSFLISNDAEDLGESCHVSQAPS